jgi:metallo-beta-lactamase family protein
MTDYPRVHHHGAVDGVTGSCHELKVDHDNGVLIDCGLFQGDEKSEGGAAADQLQIEFPIAHIRALLVTHVHIDHVGRIPYLLGAGFKGPIFCTEPSAVLLPLVLEDAIKVGFTRDKGLVRKVLKRIAKQIVPVPYKKWQEVKLHGMQKLAIRFQQAGHILGSSYIECKSVVDKQEQITVFSGDLGAPYAPLLPNPKPPQRADVVVIESTYGNRLHEGRKQRRDKLRKALFNAFRDGGVVMIPAFSIGRTQELLYEIEDIIFRLKKHKLSAKLPWGRLPIIVDSPLAARFNDVYRKLRGFWDAEARQRLGEGRHPLSFEQLITIDSHPEHMQLVNRLQKSGEPCVVLAASGMCSGGRIVNYLKALIDNPVNDIVFVGYQARGTPGRAIQQYGPRGGYVHLDDERYDIRARITTLGGYSAHADQADLLRFIERIKKPPREVRIVHGDDDAKMELMQLLMRGARQRGDTIDVVIP